MADERVIWGTGASWDGQPQISHLFCEGGDQAKKAGLAVLSKKYSCSYKNTFFSYWNFIFGFSSSVEDNLII